MVFADCQTHMEYVWNKKCKHWSYVWRLQCDSTVQEAVEMQKQQVSPHCWLLVCMWLRKHRVTAGCVRTTSSRPGSVPWCAAGGQAENQLALLFRRLSIRLHLLLLAAWRTANGPVTSLLYDTYSYNKCHTWLMSRVWQDTDNSSTGH